jgi:hypothetical protein
MDNNLVMTGIGTFNQVYSDKEAGSKRAKTGVSPGLEHILTIKHTSFVENSTKVKYRRSVVRFDQNIVIDAVGTIAPISIYQVAAVPLGSVDISAAVINNVHALTVLLASGIADSTQLGKGSAIYVTGEQ